MKDIGSGHGGKTPAQVAINWVMCKGAIPIVGEFLLGLCLCVSCLLFFVAVFPLCCFALYCAVLCMLFHVPTFLSLCPPCHVFLCSRGGGWGAFD